MGAMQRNKGRAGEQELARLLREHLGVEVRRNLQQSREGGADLAGLPGVALEVKRAAAPSLSAWWEQTRRQAHEGGGVPVLAFRLDRRPWRFILPLEALGIVGGQGPGLEATAELSLEAFCLTVRERLLPDGGTGAAA
ncbi:MAG: hypothetical protein HQL51_05860 [Magnetococcales bacterium]|nr:hypothetical protein [Magnetococcales bacterium]